MKKTIFECDACKAQSPGIFEVKVGITKMVIDNVERDHGAPPIEFTIQICGLDCLQKAIASKAGHALAKVEKVEEKEKEESTI